MLDGVGGEPSHVVAEGKSNHAAVILAYVDMAGWAQTTKRYSGTR